MRSTETFLWLSIISKYFLFLINCWDWRNKETVDEKIGFS